VYLIKGRVTAIEMWSKSSNETVVASIPERAKKLQQSPTPAYRYKKLSPGIEAQRSPSIRVLDLLPSDCQNDTLRCTIREVQLHDNLDTHHYEAVSYCWGDPSPVDFVLYDEARLGIGANLSVLLRRIRRHDQVRVLWVDAICINQGDLDERNAQVSLMYHIYHQATRVLIWLGEPDHILKWWDTKLAFNLASKLAKVQETRPDLDIRRMSETRKQVTRLRLGLRNPGNKRYAALRALFTRPWFQRMWVVQEAACATRATILCEEHEISWHELMRGTDFGLRSGLLQGAQIRKIVRRVHNEAPRGSLSAALQMYHLSLANSPSLNLFTLLRRFHGSCASDPRDKVFALVGLASLETMDNLKANFKDLAIHPDYREPFRDLFKRVARGILLTSPHLDLLSIPTSRSDWPSWVPDWSSRGHDTEALSYAKVLDYCSSGDSNAHVLFDDDTLILKGHIVDRIAKVVDRNAPELPQSRLYRSITRDHSRDDIIDYLTLFQHCYEQILRWEKAEPKRQDRKYVTGEEYLDVYHAMLSAARQEFESQWYGFSRIREGPESMSAALRRFYPKVRRVWALDRAVRIAFALLIGFQGFGNFDAQILQSRTFARTEQGYLALMPIEARVGDAIAICQGGKVPLLLRPNVDGKLRLLGGCYIHGMMFGERYCEKDCYEISIS
jgi:hypothetical protein